MAATRRMKPGQEKKFQRAVRWMVKRGMSAAEARAKAVEMARKGVNFGRWLEKAQSRYVKGRRIRFEK